MDGGFGPFPGDARTISSICIGSGGRLRIIKGKVLAKLLRKCLTPAHAREGDPFRASLAGGDAAGGIVLEFGKRL